MPSMPTNCASRSGSVVRSGVWSRTSARKNSFQAVMNANRVRDDDPGRQQRRDDHGPSDLQATRSVDRRGLLEVAAGCRGRSSAASRGRTAASRRCRRRRGPMCESVSCRSRRSRNSGMMIRISGNIWLSRIQPSPTPRDDALAPREDVGRRQADRRRQHRRRDRDLEAVERARDERWFSSVSASAVVLERRSLAGSSDGWSSDELARSLERHRQHPEQREAEEEHVGEHARRTGTCASAVGSRRRSPRLLHPAPEVEDQHAGDHDHHRVAERRGVAELAVLERLVVARTASAARSCPGPPSVRT